MKKKLYQLLLALMMFSMVSIGGITAFASSEDTSSEYNQEITPEAAIIDLQVIEPVNTMDGTSEDAINKADPPTTYGWDCVKTVKNANTYGAWKLLDSGTGGNLTCSNKTFVGVNLSGSLQVTKSILSAVVGFDVSWSEEVTRSYTMSVPSGHKYQMKVRNEYYNYTVTQRKYQKVLGVKTYLAGTDYSKVISIKKWNNYDWDYNVIY